MIEQADSDAYKPPRIPLVAYQSMQLDDYKNKPLTRKSYSGLFLLH
ncbi:hypothetical protein QJ527_00690 [Enterococcus mundtii]|nr:hypothetical protein [Enterococcus mundtii]MDA9428298.1 hypothetical protein [Enterococcus mundtii 1A]MDK4210065.1 hypothetical protein [Enterococcus mundtii]MDO7878362.1 hypothetical protein [Enterococcus mundtii]